MAMTGFQQLVNRGGGNLQFQRGKDLFDGVASKAVTELGDQQVNRDIAGVKEGLAGLDREQKMDAMELGLSKITGITNDEADKATNSLFNRIDKGNRTEFLKKDFEAKAKKYESEADNIKFNQDRTTERDAISDERYADTAELASEQKEYDRAKLTTKAEDNTKDQVTYDAQGNEVSRNDATNSTIDAKNIDTRTVKTKDHNGRTITSEVYVDKRTGKEVSDSSITGIDYEKMSPKDKEIIGQLSANDGTFSDMANIISDDEVTGLWSSAGNALGQLTNMGGADTAKSQQVEAYKQGVVAELTDLGISEKKAQSLIPKSTDKPDVVKSKLVALSDVRQGAVMGKVKQLDAQRAGAVYEQTGGEFGVPPNLPYGANFDYDNNTVRFADGSVSQPIR